MPLRFVMENFIKKCESLNENKIIQYLFYYALYIDFIKSIIIKKRIIQQP